MQRITMVPRPNWQEKVEKLGFEYHTVDPEKYGGGDSIYWVEDVAYKFSLDEINKIEEATNELYQRCLDAVHRIVLDKSLLLRCGINEQYHGAILKSWQRSDYDLYARFDFSYNPAIDPNPKMFEINADTPTSIFEAGIVQWFWLEDMIKNGHLPKDADQFNLIHEQLIDTFKDIKSKLVGSGVMHFLPVFDHLEDAITVEYIRDTAFQAGIDTKFGYIEDIGWDGSKFVDYDNVPITTMFKLYPWEWMMREEFGIHTTKDVVNIIEPMWKAVLSNKMLLPIMHEMFPDHPNILGASDYQPNQNTYVKKPMFSREGANVTIVKNDETVISTSGDYGQEGFIYQEFFPLPEFDGKHPVIGSWVIGGKSCGMGIREDSTLVTKNTSHFIPHFIGA